MAYTIKFIKEKIEILEPSFNDLRELKLSTEGYIFKLEEKWDNGYHVLSFSSSIIDHAPIKMYSYVFIVDKDNPVEALSTVLPLYTYKKLAVYNSDLFEKI